MIKKDIIIIKNKGEAEEIAIKWQKWQSERNMSYSEILEWSEYFKMLANKFDLEEEFKENGII